MLFHEIYKSLTSPMKISICEDLFTEHKDYYSAAVNKLAPMQNLRPLFVLRKPVADRHKWLAGALSRRMAESVTAHLLQIWLTAKHKPMLVQFLDALGVKHDGEGLVEEMPDAPETAALQSAIDGLMANYPQETVALYLHIFVAIDDAPWATLVELMESDPRLALPQPAATA